MLKGRESYNPEGDFLPDSFSVEDFNERVKKDITLFFGQKGKASYEKHMRLLRVRPRDFK